MQQANIVKGRLAPSPSGRMHLGNLFSALLAWLSAKSRGGKIVLRIENLDPLRTSFEHAYNIMKDFEYYGLFWDEGPQLEQNFEIKSGSEFFQSERSGFYNSIIERLNNNKLIYPCFCSRAELHAANAPHQSDGGYVYNGKCRLLSQDEIKEKQKLRGAALRLAVSDEEIIFNDLLQGEFKQNLKKDAGDFILRRSDGVFAYMLCAPADDGEMGITEVVRGRDLLQSTPSQIYLLKLLGYDVPQYVHIPMLLDCEGRRLSKRDKDLDLGVIISKSKSPHPLLGALAHAAGIIDKNEPLSAEELIKEFSWEKLNKQDIIINSMNKILN